jgi:hypothetical protein
MRWLLIVWVIHADGSAERYSPTVEFPDAASCASADISSLWTPGVKLRRYCIPQESEPK